MRPWDGIDEFVAVANAGSFTRGAKVLGMSVSHVSRAIIDLERRLSAQLFHRTTRTVRLTDTGRALLDRCERIVQQREEAFALIGEKGEPQGELRVTCSTTMGERYVVPILRRYAMQYPRLKIDVELSNRVIDLVAEDFDLAIRTGSTTDPRLIATPIATRAIYTCAAPAYLARRGEPARVEDLAGHECIGGTAATWQFEVDGQQVLHRPEGRFRCNSGQAVTEACLAGMGICQIPHFYALPYLQEGSVKRILEHARPADEQVWAVYHQRRHLLPKVQRAVEILGRELGPAMRNPR